MGKPRLLLGGSGAGAADVQQGGYFRGMLIAERDAATSALAKCRADLTKPLGFDEAAPLELLQRDILTRQLELDHVNYLIEALDERFASHWLSS